MKDCSVVRLRVPLPCRALYDARMIRGQEGDEWTRCGHVLSPPSPGVPWFVPKVFRVHRLFQRREGPLCSRFRWWRHRGGRPGRQVHDLVAPQLLSCPSSLKNPKMGKSVTFDSVDHVGDVATHAKMHVGPSPPSCTPPHTSASTPPGTAPTNRPPRILRGPRACFS